MTEPLSLGYSTCPNDTFIFHALAHGQVDLSGFGGVPPRIFLADVEELNRMALAGEPHICKISAAVFGAIRDKYVLLSSGAAIGRGNGPVLVTRNDFPRSAPLTTIAIPGAHTTAARLLERYTEKHSQIKEHKPVPMRFDMIVPAILERKVDAGVLIHEGRFTYHSLGLRLIQDMGQWWEQTYGLPLPLGCIVARRDIPQQQITQIDRAIRQSLEQARANPAPAMEYVRQHAKELDATAISSHIATFVTAYSLDMGTEGRQAIARLLG